MYGTTVERILAANPGLSVNNLQIGQQICIPSFTPVCNGIRYTVKAGDTAYLIARAYGISLTALMKRKPERGPEHFVCRSSALYTSEHQHSAHMYLCAKCSGDFSGTGCRRSSVAQIRSLTDVQRSSWRYPTSQIR